MVSSYLALIQRRYVDLLDNEGREFIGFALDGAERMKGLIAALLGYGRVESLAAPFERVDLTQTFEDALHNLEVAVSESEATVTSGKLPSVSGDPRQLTQLFQNLIANGVKFRRPDTPPQVHVETEQEDRRWHFTVTDNGIGIDPKFADTIFKPFSRLHAHDQYAGSGIGLAVCRKIVERHEGTIWVTSKPTQGSTFHFSLPISDGVRSSKQRGSDRGVSKSGEQEELEREALGLIERAKELV